MKKSRFSYTFIVLILIFLSFVFLYKRGVKQETGSGEYYVLRVVDGDTLMLSTRERVRLIGVDTPEHHESQKLYREARRTKQDIKTVQALGKRATQFTKKLCKGKKVRLEFEERRHDDYGRLLAYVFLEDGTLLNEEIIRQGYGTAYTRFPFKYRDAFRHLEQEARQNNRGLWSD